MGFGGWGRNRTGVGGVAVRSITTLLPSLGGALAGAPSYSACRLSSRGLPLSRGQGLVEKANPEWKPMS